MGTWIRDVCACVVLFGVGSIDSLTFTKRNLLSNIDWSGSRKLFISIEPIQCVNCME